MAKYLYGKGENNPNWIGGLVTLKCKSCKKEHMVKPYRKDKSKYCSFKCHGVAKINTVPWNKGTKGLTGANSGSFKQGIIPSNFKKEGVGYRSLHHWVVWHRGQPDTCEHCGATGLSGREVHWANKSQLYKRDLGDWLRLCVKCHTKYDRERRYLGWLMV